MNKYSILSVLFSAAALFLSACSEENPVPELQLVPGTALMHIHVESDLNYGFTSLAGDLDKSFVLADSLLKMGPLGLSLVGIDISTLEPQLLILTENVTAEYATALAARVLDLDPKQEDNRVDLISEHGYSKASVTQRDGWTAIYTGPAPHVTLGNWLNLKKDASLAADSSLAKVIPDHKHITVLFPGNLFGFLSLLPLERQIPWWPVYKDAAATVKPAALALYLSWPNATTEEPVQAGMVLARRDGGVTSVELSISDTRIDTDSCFVMLMGLIEGSILNE